MRQQEAAGRGPHLIQGAPQARLNHLQLTLHCRPVAVIYVTGGTPSGDVVQAEQRQADVLCRAIVQLDAEAAKEALIEGGRAGRCSSHPGVNSSFWRNNSVRRVT